MAQSKTVFGRYIFLDIVNYSYERTVEAQTDIIAEINKLVKDSMKFFDISEKNRILIPTGDGMCIALLEINNPFDVHMKLALKILELLNRYNQSQKDEMRKFQIRIGINANTDNLVIDINGNKNIAGAGITEAQRIMDQGGGGNIFVGRSVYEHLRQREWYVGKFRKSPAIVKHKQKIEMYQFVDASITYLNSEDPKESNIMKMIRTKKEKWKDKKVNGTKEEKEPKDKDSLVNKSLIGKVSSVSSLFKKDKK